MTRSFSPASLIIVLFLHAGLIAWAITGLPKQPDSLPEPVSIAVRLLPVQKEEAPAVPKPVPAPPPAFTPPVPAPAPPPVSAPPTPAAPPEKKPAKPKPATKPKPKAPAKPRPSREAAKATAKAPADAQARAPTVPSVEPAQPAPPPTAAAVPQAPPAPVAPAPAAKTSVYISADYAATNRKPVYPSMSMRYGEQGTVVLRVLVKADGTAGQVEIKSSSGYPLLDESAKATVQSWRFRPATSDGKPMADWFLIPIPFKLQN
jgi:protein TonB